MKNRNMLSRLSDFVLGKGFYIALILCVAAIGISCYYLFDLVSPDLPEPSPVGGGAVVEVPEPQPVQPTLPPQPPKPERPKPQPKPAPQPEAPKEAPKAEKPEPVVYTWPVKGEVLRGFSVETLALDPTMGDWRTHSGLDIAAAAGSKVLAMAAGQVKEIHTDGLMGTTVVVEHRDGVTSVYCGLEPELAVAAGDAVETGAVLGNVGETAIAESAVDSHLHLETWKDGKAVDPTSYLPLR